MFADNKNCQVFVYLRCVSVAQRHFAQQNFISIPNAFFHYMLNSMSAVIWEDLLKPKFGKCADWRVIVRKVLSTAGHISDTASTRVNKVICVLLGCIATSMTFVCERMGGMINVSPLFIPPHNSFQAVSGVIGATAAPLGGLFLSGILIPHISGTAALLSFVISEAIMLWIMLSTYLTRPFR